MFHLSPTVIPSAVSQNGEPKCRAEQGVDLEGSLDKCVQQINKANRKSPVK